MLLSYSVVLVLLHASLASGAIIQVSNGGPWGNWGSMENCPEYTLARGFRLLVESPQGREDDTALNGIQLYCMSHLDDKVVATITSTRGSWGRWTGAQFCPSGVIYRFSLKVEQPIVDGDDTAANNIMFQCSDYTMLRGYGEHWGTFGSWSNVCRRGICGIKTRVEGPQGNGDDTALNDVQFRCC